MFPDTPHQVHLFERLLADDHPPLGTTNVVQALELSKSQEMADSSPLSARSLWGDGKYSDATIIMGEKTWHVHRWVICEQSKYFEKALEGKFKESNSKTIDLTDSQFSEQQVDLMLKYLYLKKLDPAQKKKPIKTFLVADYFQVTALRDRAAEELSTHLNSLKLKKHFADFNDCCFIVLVQHPGTHLEKIVVKVIADNIDWVMHESGGWDALTTSYPSLAKKVLEVLYPSPEAMTFVKRPAGVAFDDTLQPAKAKKGPGYRPGRVTID